MGIAGKMAVCACTLGMAVITTTVGVSAAQAEELDAYEVNCSSMGITEKVLTGHVGDTFTVTNNDGGGFDCVNITLPPEIKGPITVAAGTTETYTLAAATNGEAVVATWRDEGAGLLELTVTILPAETSTSVTRSAAPTWTLAYDSHGGVCAAASVKALNSTWVQTPSATDCSLAGRTLLGWSTSADFPVSAAQRQVDLGWGAMDEIVNGTRMIFVPAGMSTAASGDNVLHAIWK